MLPLVRSQRASLERLRAAIRWARGLVVLTGAPGQGKSTVIQALQLATPFSPLRLEGEVIKDRHDAVMRLVALVGLRPEGDDFALLARLQNKQSAGTDQGVPEVLVEDAHCLSDDTLQFFSELASGVFGRAWSIVLIGEQTVLDRLVGFGVLPSVVRLPRWDGHDLREALAKASVSSSEQRPDALLLSRYSDMPKRLLRAALEERGTPWPLDAESSNDAESDPNSSDEAAVSPMFRYLLMVGGLLAALFIAYLWWEAQRPEAPSAPVTIPLTPKS